MIVVKNISIVKAYIITKKKCNTNITIDITTDKEDLIKSKDELIKYLISENKDYKNLILEIVKKDNISNSNGSEKEEKKNN